MEELLLELSFGSIFVGFSQGATRTIWGIGGSGETSLPCQGGRKLKRKFSALQNFWSSGFCPLSMGLRLGNEETELLQEMKLRWSETSPLCHTKEFVIVLGIQGSGRW